MTRRSIYGFHDLGGQQHLPAQDGWFCDAIAIGHDPTQQGGPDYTYWTQYGRVICRLNNDWNPGGTIPLPAYYNDFAQRCANVVRGSKGCTRWVIGNEPNLSIERPGDQPIQPESYAECFLACRDAIHGVEGHEQDEVIPAAIGPWNVETGDPLVYWTVMLNRIVQGGRCGALAIHTYTHGADPALVTVDDIRHGWQWEFRAYQDFMHLIPPDLTGVPVYLTETNQCGVWQSTRWLQAAYTEINNWNQNPEHQKIHCLLPFRWTVTSDGYGMANRADVLADFDEAVSYGYTVGEKEGDDMIVNPSMEQPYIKQGGTVWVAAGWTAWWNTGDPPQEQSQGPLAQPEFKEAPISLDAHRVSEGLSSQCWFIGSKVMDGGVYQTIQTEAGKWYRYAVDAQTWCSDNNDPYTDDGEMYFMIGLDPDGGTNPKSTSIVWMQWDKLIKNFKRITSQQVKATGPTMTVFLRGWNKWRLRHNDVYVDNGELVSESDPDPEPPGPTPTECNALTADEIRTIVREEIRIALESVKGQITFVFPD